MKVALGFSRTNNLPSKLIRWFTKSQVSHTYLRLYVPTFKRYFVLHADWDGVKFELAEKFDTENIVIKEYIINDKRLDDAIVKNLWYIGRRYDYVKLFNWAWAIMLKRWIVRKVKDPSADPKKLICVDFNLYVFNGAGITNLPIGEMHPQELDKWCEDNREKMNWKLVIHEDTKTLIELVKEFLIGD